MQKCIMQGILIKKKKNDAQGDNTIYLQQATISLSAEL